MSLCHRAHTVITTPQPQYLAEILRRRKCEQSSRSSTAGSARGVSQRVGHHEPVEPLAVSEVFGEQAVAAEFDGAGDDEAVAPRQRVAVFEGPRGHHGVVVDDGRSPCLEVSDVVACGCVIEPPATTFV